MQARIASIALICAALLTGGALASPPDAATERPVIALVTDFGTANEAVGECHGAILSVDKEVAIVDLSHHVTPFDIAEGAHILAKATHFPKGTIFVGVIDPGVGTSRRSVAFRTSRGFYYVAPDNGLLDEVLRTQHVDAAVELEPKKVNPDWTRGTFDGRDLYSPAGAMLAANKGDLLKIGKPIDPATILRLPSDDAIVDRDKRTVRGKYERTDEPYGNIWTNITALNLGDAKFAPGDKLDVEIGGKRRVVPWVESFGAVDKGMPLAYLNSEGRLAFAVNMGDCRKDWGAPVKSPVTLRAVSSGK